MTARMLAMIAGVLPGATCGVDVASAGLELEDVVEPVSDTLAVLDGVDR